MTGVQGGYLTGKYAAICDAGPVNNSGSASSGASLINAIKLDETPQPSFLGYNEIILCTSPSRGFKIMSLINIGI